MGEETEVGQLPRYWLPDAVYQALKWVGLLALPTAAWAYQALAGIFGWPLAINVCGTAIAVLIGASSIKAMGGGADG